MKANARNPSKKTSDDTFKKKRNWLFSIALLYLFIAGVLIVLLSEGIITKAPVTKYTPEGSDSIPDIPSNFIVPHLRSAQNFLEQHMIEENGHIYLYIMIEDNKTPRPMTYPINENISDISDENTNSEAASYYLLWTAKSKDKINFDRELDFVKQHMLHPKFGYMMWRLTPNDTVESDGSNIASDADLRTIKALLIAEEQWHDSSYTDMIDQLANGLERVAITKDGYLAPYGGASGETSTWTANEVWLSYTDFAVLDELSKRYGAPWNGVYANMKQAVLNAQLANGLYNSMLTESRQYGNGIDAGGYSINSMWIMIRGAESEDLQLRQSANKSLQFYKNKFEVDGELYSNYGSNGDALSPADNPWVYALVGRAAIALNDSDFSKKMMQKLIEKQINDTSSKYHGAFYEDYKSYTRVGQFTMQESILTMQDFAEHIKD